MAIQETRAETGNGKALWVKHESAQAEADKPTGTGGDRVFGHHHGQRVLGADSPAR